MAYDLTARLTLQDRFSNRMNRVTRQMKKAEKQSNMLGENIAGIGSAATASAGRVGGLAKSFIGLGAAIGGAMAAKKLFDKTILGAAKYEQSSILIKAMFQDEAKSSDFMKRMTKLAQDSPVLNSQDIFETAKGFISVTKNVDKLEDMYRIVEKLNVLDPAQGVQGAALAFKELLSGDSMSMVERFEMPRSIMNDIKKLDMSGQIQAMDKLLDKMGITDETVEDIGSSTTALWNQIMEKLDMIFVKMGQPALAKIRKFLDNVNTQMENGDKGGFLKFGQDALVRMAEGFINGSTMLARTIESIINDPEFIKAETVGGKAKFIMNKFYEGLNNWLDGGGRDKIQNVTNSLVSTIVSGIENNTGPIVNAALTIGSKIGSAVASGIKESITSNPLAKLVLGAIAGGAAGSVIPGIGTAAGAVIGGASSLTKHYTDKLGNLVTPDSIPKSMHGKLRMEGNSQRSSVVKTSPSNNNNISISGNTFNVRKDSDIKEIARQLSSEINKAGLQLGY